MKLMEKWTKPYRIYPKFFGLTFLLHSENIFFNSKDSGESWSKKKKFLYLKLILYIDLLFYHLKLRSYVVVELKAREFDSRDAGQMSAYLSAVDDLLRHEDDKPSIGMILCKTKDNVFVEYVLTRVLVKIRSYRCFSSLIFNGL